MESVKRLYRYALRYWQRIVLVLLLMVAGTALTMAQPKIIQWTFDYVFEEGNRHLLIWMALGRRCPFRALSAI